MHDCNIHCKIIREILRDKDQHQKNETLHKSNQGCFLGGSFSNRDNVIH